MRYVAALLLCSWLLPAIAAAEQPAQAPMPPPNGTAPIGNWSASNANENKANSVPSSERARALSPETGVPDRGSAWISPPPPAPPVSAPLPYPVTGAAEASKAEDLTRAGASLMAQGDFTRAMELYNEAAAIAPRYGEVYRQRALALVRIGDRVQAQKDYVRYLEFDPQARTRILNEISLYQGSGYAKVGEAEGVIGPGRSPGDTALPETAGLESGRSYRPAELADLDYSLARSAFQRGDYVTAYQWAQRANGVMPQARTHALMAQSLFARGFYSGAANEARTAAGMGPLIDWTTLYGLYNYKMWEFGKQFKALEDYVRQNPSSADARFLLGYEHLVLGQTEPAHAQLAIAAVLEPLDVAATSLLAREGVEIVSGKSLVTKNMLERGGVTVTARNEPTVPGPPPVGAAVPAARMAERPAGEVTR
jgi:tetratricopeptide (TPR) repeat protein